MTSLHAATRRELTRQLASPASWLIVGLFALLAGVAFVTTLNAFLDRSSEALSAPPIQPINVHQHLVRPFLLRIGLAALLVLPLITAPAYTRDRARRDPAHAVATFLATLSVYVVMLLPSALLLALLFVYGAPEWGPIVSGTSGLLLFGAAFMSVALLVSSLATSAWSAGLATGAIALMLAAATWLARSGSPAAQPLFRSISIGEGLDDFAKGVIDTGHIVSCLTIVGLGLFLTRRALEAARSEP